MIKPPPGVDFALQVGKGTDYKCTQLQKANGKDLQFHLDVIIKKSSNTELDFSGPSIQGPKGERFIYIGIGTYAGIANSPWGRRLKIPLRGISATQVHKAEKDPHLIFETSVPGTGRDGTPNCATVKPFDGWELKGA